MRANEGEIKKHLQVITKRWGELDQEADFEIRCLLPENSKINKSKKFKRDQIQNAVKYAIEQNEKYNVYVTINPIAPNRPNPHARDEDILCAFYCYCDCDTPESVVNLQNTMQEGFVGSFSVHTGQKPKRGHMYYEMTQPMVDLDHWRIMQKAIAHKIRSDEVVNNPSRIMRLGGTVNYPDKGKREKGRVIEMTTFTQYDAPQRTQEEMKEFFPSPKNKEPFNIYLQGMTQTERLDIENALSLVKTNQDWHNNMIRIVASLVARGRTDQEIHAYLSGITQTGFTLEETTKEIDVAIEGARNKGFTGQSSQSTEVFILPDLSDTEIDSYFRKIENVNPLSIPRREWLYGNHYIKDYLSLTVAPGGVGKSTLVLTEALAMVTGKALLGIQPLKECKVWYFNAEDPRDEILRRIIALCQHYKIDYDKELDGLYFGSGREVEMLLMAGDHGTLNTKLIDMIRQRVKEYEIELIIIDPLASVMTSSESVDNFKILAKSLSMLADECKASIEIVHHTRKLNNAQEVSVEDSRGGSSLVSAARSARILTKMDAREGDALGLEDYIDYFKIEPAGKNNLSRPLDKISWYKKIGVTIPNDDIVAVVEEYKPPSAFDGITHQKLKQLWESIKGTDTYLMASIQSARTEHKMSVHEYIADFLELDYDAKVTKTRVKTIVRSWLDSKMLKIKSVPKSDVDPKSYRKDMVKIVVTGENIPGNMYAN